MKLTNEQARTLYDQHKYVSYTVRMQADPNTNSSYSYNHNIGDDEIKKHSFQLCTIKEYQGNYGKSYGHAHSYYYFYEITTTNGSLYGTFRKYGGTDASKNLNEFLEFQNLVAEFPDCCSYYIGDMTEGKHKFNLCVFIDLNMFQLYYNKNGKLTKNMIGIIKKYAMNQYKITNLKDCSNEQEYPNISPNFKLTLFDYQRQTINWMIRTENTDYKFLVPQSCFFKLGHRIYVELINRRQDTLLSQYIFNNDYQTNKMIRCRGGILADIMGNGKTITTIALIYHNQPITYPLLTTILEREVYIPSKATLVICPTNIAAQWEGEIYKALGNDGSGLRILKITTKVQMNKYNLYDIVNADVIITTYDWLSHTNHIGVGFAKKNKSTEFLSKQKEYISTYGDNYHAYPQHNLLFQKYNRIIYDEFHEEIDSNSGNSNILYIIKNCLKAKYIWGVSGTPLLENENVMANIPNLLQIYDDNNELYELDIISQHEVYNRFVRRNEKQYLLPISYKEVRVTQTLQEKQLYDSSKSQNAEVLMQLACYHNLSNMGIQSIDDVSKGQETVLLKQKKDLQEKAEELCSNLKQIETLLKAMNPTINHINDLYYLIDSKHPKHTHKLIQQIQQTPTLQLQVDNLRQYRKMQKQCDDVNSELESLIKCINYYNITTKAFNNGVFTCPITGEPAGDGEVVITKHGHLFSKGAIDMLFDCGDGKTITCPVTTQKLTLADITIVSNKKDISGENLNSNQRLFGSKITSIIDEINKLPKLDKVIIFAKWDTLLHTIGYALDTNNISSVYIRGSVAAREKSINEFRHNPKVKVILLSADFGASGVNLMEAHHVFIVHPFIGDNGSQYEKQAIARAHRTGQKKPVEVTFFITNNTVESDLWDKDRKLHYKNKS